MFDNSRIDLRRYSRRFDALTLFQKCRLLVQSYGFHAILVYRLGRWSENQVLVVRPLLLAVSYLLEACVRALYGIHTKRTARIEPGLYIAHFGGILLGDCQIGSNCSVSQRVVIDKDERGSPVIGGSVWIGPHARIVGPIHVGEGATIGAGAVVASDVPSRSLVLGNPARVINKNYDNSSILSVMGMRPDK